MYCEKCGAELEPNERFCPFCGHVVETNPEPSSPPPPPPAPQSPPADPPVPDPGKRPGSKKPVIVGAAVAAIVLAAILAAVFLPGGRDKPGNAAVSPAPNQSAAPSGEPSGAGGMPSSAEPSEIATPTAAPVALADLPIGAWAAEGCTVGDEENGWTALYLTSVNGNTLTFTLEKISAAMSFNRIATTDPITVKLENGRGTFLVENDGWFNSGTGIITVNGDAIHVSVGITTFDPMANWDLGMDADFYPV